MDSENVVRLAGLLLANAPATSSFENWRSHPLSYRRIEGCGALGDGSNARPLAYKARALPAELRGRWQHQVIGRASRIQTDGD